MHDIYIFDFDYTLFKTYEEIILWTNRGENLINGKKCRFIGPDEFNSLIIAEDEHVNDESFVNFKDVDTKRVKPIKPCIERFHSCSNKIILSARPQCIEPKIKELLGDVNYIGLESSDPKAKLEVIKKYENPCVYEDSNKLINMLRSQKIDCVKVELEIGCTNLRYYYNE